MLWPTQMVNHEHIELGDPFELPIYSPKTSGEAQKYLHSGTRILDQSKKGNHLSEKLA